MASPVASGCGLPNVISASLPSQGLPRLSLFPKKSVLPSMPHRWHSEGLYTRSCNVVCVSRRQSGSANPCHRTRSRCGSDSYTQEIETDLSIDGQDNQNIQRNYRIRILLAAGIDLFPIDKTLPTKACIRSSAPKIEVERPSPTYNATIRSECCSLLSSRLLHQSVDQSSSFRDACMLGAIWLRQRGIGASIAKGGFGQFEWASVMSALMHSGERANRRDLMTSYSSYQLFKATLQFLANTDLVALDVACTNHPILFDESRSLNLLFKMSSWSYKRVRGLSSNQRPFQLTSRSFSTKHKIRSRLSMIL